jgi:hypothetical protein
VSKYKTIDAAMLEPEPTDGGITRIACEWAGKVIGIPVLCVFVGGLWVFDKVGRGREWVRYWVGVEK